MKKTTPRRAGIIQRFATSCVRSHGASTFSRWTARNPLSAIDSAGAANCPPALLTRMSTRAEPRADRVQERRDLLGLAHVARQREDVAPVGLELARRTASSGSGRRPQIATRAPVRASSSAVARPIPVPPPVTIATAPAFASAVSGERNPGDPMASASGEDMPERKARTVVG